MSLVHAGSSQSVDQRPVINGNMTMRRFGSFGSRNENWWSLSDHVPSHHDGSSRTTLEDTWALSDSLVDISPDNYMGNVLKLSPKQKPYKQKDIDTWLEKDTCNGFVRIYPPDIHSTDSELVPCTLTTTVQKLCLQMGLANNVLHVQYSGDVIRRVDPYANPLVLQNEYLSSLGYVDMTRIQREGTREELSSLIKFYAGKPFVDFTYVKNSTASLLLVRKGKLFYQWTERLCVLSGTQLLIYRDRTKRSKPTILQLCKGGVELVRFKDRDYCLKVTSSAQNNVKSFYLAMTSEMEFLKWLKKFRKATSKLPTSTDLSNCHLEYMPETVFVNTDIKALNLRRNTMKERPLDEDAYTIGWLDDISRFTKLRSLNLSDNELRHFPLSICNVVTLVELNLSSNKIEELPADISYLKSLEVLHMHNNRLSSLPDTLIALPSLSYLILAFNKFTHVPATLIQLAEAPGATMTTVVMCGNDIEKISPETLGKMRNITRLSLQMNRLTLRPTETVKFNLMERLTYLDIRQNKVRDLDVRCIKTLEHLNCERNQMTSLQVNGTHLKYLRASHNYVSTLVISPKPEWLEHFDLSHNRLSRLPDFLSSCFFMKSLLVNHNKLKQIPDRLMCDASALKILALNHNNLSELPQEVERFTVEEFYLHRNQLEHIPRQLLSKCNKLRVLNLSRNKLTSLPIPHEFEDHNKLQELYVSHNRLRDDVMDVVGQYPRLKVLHLAYNKLQEICEHSLSRLEQLRELNISGNRLTSLPECMLHLSSLTVLRAHSNLLKSLPDFEKMESLKILDVGSNQLLDISMKSLMDSQINLLDMSLNDQLSISTDDIMSLRNTKSVCFVDITGMNRSLPGTPQSSRGETDTDDSQPWQVGLAETSGSRNRLCISVLKNVKLEKGGGHVFAMFDGGYNHDVPSALQLTVPPLLDEEFGASPGTPALNMKYAVLGAHRSLRLTGQKLGAAVAVVHLSRSRGDCYQLTVANCGDVEAVLSRNNEVILLTRNFTVIEDREELDRIRCADGLITEDNRIYGTAQCTRLLGSSYLHPHVIPDPHTCCLNLGSDDRFIVIASRCLWQYMTYQEVVLEVLQVQHPVLAAKKLQDVAQSYGCKENLSVVVIYLQIGRESTWEASIYDDQFYLQDSSDDGSMALSDEARTPEGTMRLKPLGAKRYVRKGNAGDWEFALQKRLTDSVKERELETSVERIQPEMSSYLLPPDSGGEWRLSSAETKRRFLKKHQAGLSHLSKMETNGKEEIGIENESLCFHQSLSSSSESSASTLCDEEGRYRKVDAQLNALLDDDEVMVNGSDVRGSDVMVNGSEVKVNEVDVEMNEIGKENGVMVNGIDAMVNGEVETEDQEVSLDLSSESESESEDEDTHF